VPVPTAQDVYDLLEGYNVGASVRISGTATLVTGSPVLTLANKVGINRLQGVSGVGIPIGAFVKSIDDTGLQITISAPVTASASGVAVTFYAFSTLSEGWLANMRDRMVIPWVCGKLKMDFTAVQTATEYYSGDGGSILVLRRRPIVDLIAVSYTNVVANQYYISPLSIQIINDEGVLKAKANFNEANYTPVFARGERNLRVQYTYGGADYPPDVFHIITCGMAEKALAQIGARTGGGSLSVQAFSRNYGALGKYHDIRQDLARQILTLMRLRVTGVTQA
jgi:hypothetical protein